MTYAVTRRLTVAQPTLDARGQWGRAASPALEQVLLVLRTQTGDCPAMPSLGVDWRRIDKLRTSAAADADTAIRAGLMPLVRAGAIRDVVVTVKVSAARGTIVYSVDFFDVLLASPRATTTGLLTVGA